MLIMKTLGLVLLFCFMCRGSRLLGGLATTLESNAASTRARPEEFERYIAK